MHGGAPRPRRHGASSPSPVHQPCLLRSLRRTGLFSCSPPDLFHPKLPSGCRRGRIFGHSLAAPEGSSRRKMTRCWLALVVSASLLCALCGDARKEDPDGLPSPGGDAVNKTAGLLGEEKLVEEPAKVGDGKKGEGEGRAGAAVEEKGSGNQVNGKAGEEAEVVGEDHKAGARGDATVSSVGTKEGTAHVEECDAPNKCFDEKNKFVACLRVPGNDSPTLSLLIQNKGTSSLTVNILAPDYVSLEQNAVLLNADEDKKVKVTVEYGVNNTPILLSAGDGHCNLSFWDMIPSSIREAEGYSVPSHINFFIGSIFMYLAVASVVLLGAAWLWVKFQRMHRLMDPRYQRLDGGLPVSSGGVMENDDGGWQNNWDGSWDDEEAPKTPSKALSNLSSKGLASRKLNKDGWKD